MRGYWQRALAAVAAAAMTTAVVGTTTAQASPAEPSPHISGVTRAVSAGGGASSGGQLLYHDGPVMHANTVHAVYWVPSGYSMDPSYRATIDRFFSDVAADSGRTTNVYSTTSQYGDKAGAAAYASTFAGSVVVNDKLPKGSCSDPYTKSCITDADIAAEVRSVATARGWSSDPSALVFLFTAKGIGSCIDATSGACAFTYYCAYHGWDTAADGTNLYYANMPYADTVPDACDAGQRPNGNDADATLNVTSHEHNEAVTDPLGTAWFDRTGAENGDKCAWDFGAASGPAGGQWNQTINGDHYYLQREWSNKTARCASSA